MIRWRSSWCRHGHKEQCGSLKQAPSNEGNWIPFSLGQKTASCPQAWMSLVISSECCPHPVSVTAWMTCSCTACPRPRKASGNKQHLALPPKQRHCFFNNTALWKPSPALLRSQAVPTLTWWSLLSSAGQRPTWELWWAPKENGKYDSVVTVESPFNCKRQRLI